MIIQQGQPLRAIKCDEFPECRTAHSLRNTNVVGRLAIEPEGYLPLPRTRVSIPAGEDYQVHRPMIHTANGKLPAGSRFPRLSISVAEEAYCLPHAPPLLAHSGLIVTDYLVPWAPHEVPWWTPAENGTHSSNVTLDTTRIQHDVPVGFYLDHSIAMHFGHFVGDCLPRLYALDVCRALFGDVKVIIAEDENAEFQTHLLNAAGVPSRDIVRFSELLRCRRLLMATNAFSVEIYASPTSARLWSSIRDGSAIRDVTLPDRIYLTRGGTGQRNMANESEVERVFERHGFTIIRPETLRIETQIALMANAMFVAGPGGSGMFNLAFQGRLRSVFVLMWESFIQVSELLFCAGRSSSLSYHIGKSLPPGSDGVWAADIPRLEADVADWLRTGT